MKCAVLSAMGRVQEARTCAEEVLRLGRGCRSPVECSDESECEVLYGRAGYLQTILFVRSVLPPSSSSADAEEFGRDVAINTIRAVIDAGISTARRHRTPLPLLWEWHDTHYLGAAHGLVGIFQTLMSYVPELREVGDRMNLDVLGLVRSAVDRLEDLCFPTGNLRSSVGRERDKLVHWCHGAPGYVMLLVKSYEVWGDGRYLRRAERVARDVVYRRGLLRKGVGLCHGISGNAYVFLAVRRGRRLEAERRRASGDVAEAKSEEEEENDKWLGMARTFAGFAVEHLGELERVPDRPYSLFEGSAGLAALLLDLTQPDRAKFPCYEF